VCYSQNEVYENATSEISSHMSYQSVVCDGSDQSYRCTKTESTATGKNTLTEVFECCPGFSRKPTDFGCPREVELADLPTVLETLNLTEFTNLMDSSGLSKKIFGSSDNNFTIFVPSNDALKTFATSTLQTVDKDLKLQDDPNVIMVSQKLQQTVVEDTRNVLLGHVTLGRYTSPQLADDQLVATASPFKTSIRINTYETPVKLMTANCRKLTSVDNMATNGVVHVVDGVLTPVGDTLLELVSKNPELSHLKTALGSSSLGSMLREEDGQYTLFAPTDAAFEKHAKTLQKIMANSKCLDKVLKNHLLPNVICSSVIEGEARTQNLLERYANMTRDLDNKLYVDGAQVVGSDVMATNGVLHIIDDVLLPDEALGLLELAEKLELTEFGQLVAKAGVKKELSNLDNVTIFVPSNAAIQALSAAEVQALTDDPDYFKTVLQHHVVSGSRAISRVYNDLMLDTIPGFKLRLNEYSMFPFRRDWTRTVQCARFESQQVAGCNGVMYVIDKVLLPPKGNVVDVLAQDSRFSTLVELLKIARLADALQEAGPFTVFAPTNDAFNELGSDAVLEMKENNRVLKSVLLNHVTQDAVCCAGILRTNWLNTQKVRTLTGEIFEIGKTRRDVNYIGNADITSCDTAATNGVVHVVDRVIMKQRPHSDPFWDFFW